MKKSWWYRRL